MENYFLSLSLKMFSLISSFQEELADPVAICVALTQD